MIWSALAAHVLTSHGTHDLIYRTVGIRIVPQQAARSRRTGIPMVRNRP